VAGYDGGAFTSPDTDLVNYDIVLSGTTVPEPSTWLLLGGGGLIVAFYRRRKQVVRL
jgi:hypothetical protein